MAEFRGGLIVDVDGGIDDATIGVILDVLKESDGAMTVEPDRLTIVFSFDASDLPGMASGLAAAMPRIVGFATRLLVHSGLHTRTQVVGMSIERVATGP